MNGPLTPRQVEILALLVQGKTAKQVGAELGVSHRTVEVVRFQSMLKLGMTFLEFRAAMWQAAGFEGAALQGLVRRVEEA
jgi:DNA-binding NarL/FixJ family response regulator